MSLLCREFCLKVHLPADWNLEFFVRILQNQIFQITHHKNAGIFLKGKEDQYVSYISPPKKWSSWDHLRVWQDTVLFMLTLLPHNQFPAAGRKWICAPMAFSLNSIYQSSVLSTSAGVGSHLSTATWASWWRTGSRPWSFRRQRQRD